MWRAGVGPGVGAKGVYGDAGGLGQTNLVINLLNSSGRAVLRKNADDGHFHVLLSEVGLVHVA